MQVQEQNFAGRWPQLGLTVLGGLLFCAFFYLRYAQIPPEFYTLRDDGLITLSHARNWVDYGFIGVSPSGGRVEGFSTPLQFAIFSILYAVTRMGYATYGPLQTLVCTFALGAVFIRFFAERPLAGLALTAAAGLFLSYSTSFLEWHGSGMENAVTHVFVLATVSVLVQFARNHQIRLGFAAIAVLACVSRVESIYHIAPLLAIFSLYWRLEERSWAGLRFSLVVLIGWVAINLARYLYFGDLQPNTASAQAISVGGRLAALLAWNSAVVEQSLELAESIFYFHGGFLLLATIPLLAFIKWDRITLLLSMLLMSLLLTSFLNPIFFGATRLDSTRSTSFMAVAVALWIVTLVSRVDWQRRPAWLPAIPAMIAVAVFAARTSTPYELCCGIGNFSQFGTTFAMAAVKERLPRPTVANPDLGVMSWHKQFNIVDLGRLGSPIMAKMPSPKALATYFLDIAAPDLIEFHVSYFVCYYRDTLFSDPRFREQYIPLTRVTTETHPDCGQRPISIGIWIRKDILAGSNSAERRLIDDLEALLTAPVPRPEEWTETTAAAWAPPVVTARSVLAAITRIAEEITNCGQEEGSACAYIARTAYRFLPEFKAGGRIDELRATFEQSPTGDYDVAWLDGYRDARADNTMLAVLRDSKAR